MSDYADKVREYREKHGCSIQQATHDLRKQEMLNAIDKAQNMEKMREVLREIVKRIN